MFHFFRVILTKLIQFIVFIFRLLIAPFIIASLNIKYFNFGTFFSYAKSGVREYSKLKKLLKLLPKDLVTKNIFEQLLKTEASTLNKLERVILTLKSKDILQVLNKDSLSELIYVCREQPSRLAGLSFICGECHLLLKSGNITKDINRFIKILSLNRDVNEYKDIFLYLKAFHSEYLENFFDILVDDFLLANRIYDFIKWALGYYGIKSSDSTSIFTITDRVKLKQLFSVIDRLRQFEILTPLSKDSSQKFKSLMGNINNIVSISDIFQHHIIEGILDNERSYTLIIRSVNGNAFIDTKSRELFDAIATTGFNHHKIIMRLLQLRSLRPWNLSSIECRDVIVLLKNLRDEDTALLSDVYDENVFLRKIKLLRELKENTAFLSGDPAKIAANINFVLRSRNLGRIDDIIKFTTYIKATFPEFLTDEVIKFVIDNPNDVLALKTMLERRRGYGIYPESLATKTSVSAADHAKLLALDLLLVVEQQRKLLPRNLRDIIPTTEYVGDRANVVKARQRFAQLERLYKSAFLSAPYQGRIETVEQQIKTNILNAILEAAKSASLDSTSTCYDPNKNTIIQLLTPVNIRILAEGKDSILAAQARQLFVAEGTPAQIAWRAYDYAAQKQGNPSLFVINPDETRRRIHDNGPDIEIGSAITEVRTMCAYIYLSAIDSGNAELATGSPERMNRLINTIAEIMRALNNGRDYPVKGNDASSCFPGAISRLGLAFLSHPHFVKELEAAPLQIHAKVQAIAQRKLEAIISDKGSRSLIWHKEDKQSLYYASMALGLENAREILKGTDKLEFLSLTEIEPKKIFASRARFLEILFAEWNLIIRNVENYLDEKGITIDGEQMKFYVFRSLLDLKGLTLTLTPEQKIQIGLLSVEQVTAMDDTEDMLQDFFPKPQSLEVLRSVKKYTELGSLNEREKYLMKEYYLPLRKHQDYQALLSQCKELSINNINTYCRDIIETRYSNFGGVASEAELQRKLEESHRSGQKLIDDTKDSNQFYPNWHLPEQINADLVDRALHSIDSKVAEVEPLWRARMR